GAGERSDDKRTALQRHRIAERGDADVDARTGTRECRQFGGDDDGCDVTRPEIGLTNIDAQALKHRLQRLLGEGGVTQRVAGALQADHEAVADELVFSHAFERGDVLDADLTGRDDVAERVRADRNLRFGARQYLRRRSGLRLGNGFGRG